MRLRSDLPPRLGALLLLLAGLALPLAAAVHAKVAGPQLHRAVVGLAGPAVVTQEAARRADAVPGHPVDARALETAGAVDDGAAQARRLVRGGQLDAAVVVDLRRTTDLLLVPTWTGDDAAHELERVAGAVSASYGRALRVERVPASGPGTPGLPFRLTALLVVAGVAGAATISAWRGPVAATTARGVARLAGTAAGGAVGGLVVSALAPGSFWPTAAVAWLLPTVSAWLVLAAEAVLGLGGLGLATGLLVGPVAPLLVGADPAYLPSPWWRLDDGSPQLAGLRLLQHEQLGVSVAEARSWLLLVGWAVIGLLTLAAARSVRPATGDRDGTASGPDGGGPGSLADRQPAVDEDGAGRA